jgi:hypothetical protein
MVTLPEDIAAFQLCVIGKRKLEKLLEHVGAPAFVAASERKRLEEEAEFELKKKQSKAAAAAAEAAAVAEIHRKKVEEEAKAAAAAATVAEFKRKQAEEEAAAAEALRRKEESAAAAKAAAALAEAEILRRQEEAAAAEALRSNEEKEEKEEGEEEQQQESKPFRISDHPHVLHYSDDLSGHTCDLCQESIEDNGYRCSDGCDFDMCMKCACNKPLRVFNHPHVLNHSEDLSGHKCDLCSESIEKDGYGCSDGCAFDVCMKCACKRRGFTIIVAGAGGSEGSRCNGTYSESGQHNGKPLFVHENGEARIYFNGYWKMNNEDCTGGWVYGVNDAQGPCPPSTWRTDGFSGSDATPCPTLSLLNRNGDAAKQGSANGTNGGFAGVNPFQIWYCGKKKNECKCGSCDGVCGPTNGCPCEDCYALIQVFICILLGLICV